MVGDTRYFILSTKDIPASENKKESDCFTDPSPETDCRTERPISIESDCACPTNDFVLFDSFQDTKGQLVEEDCACPTDGFALDLTVPSPLGENLFQRSPLHVELVQGFYLVFNPLGQAGVVMLNDPSWRLLQAFDQPCTLIEAANVTGDTPAVLQAVKRLASLNLIEPVSAKRRVQPSTPSTLTAWLHTTNRCNLTCPYCYLQKTPDEMEIEKGKEAVDAVFRSALANGFKRIKLKYAGGEATLNFAIVLLLHDYAEKLAGEYGLTLDGVVLSNGVALSRAMIKQMKARNLRLMISLDGVGEYHNAQRYFVNGHGSFSLVERTLDLLAVQDLTPSISITVSNRNLTGLPEIVAYVLKRKLPFTLNFFRENECSVPFIDLNYQDEALITAIKAAFAVIEENLPPESLLDALVDRARLDTPYDRPCGVGDSYMVIDQFGKVAKCHMEIEQTITDVMVADPLQIIREEQIGLQNPSVDDKEGCRECHWRYWCAGGCPALTYRKYRRYDIKSPNCRVYKAIFPEVLRLEGLRLLKYGGIAQA